MNKLDIPYIFKSEADDLIKAREDSIRIHGTADIKAAGNEIEMEVRGFLKRMLPKTLYVTHGHLIDKNGVVSPQLDVIIADCSNLPSLMTTKDGTEYVPIDSVYAVGEIKSTYYKTKKYFEKFSEVISKIKNEMAHEEIVNTAYNGTINDNTLLRDTFLCKGNRILNKIYAFMIYIDSGDFDSIDVVEHYNSTDIRYLPSLSIILNKGIVCYGSLSEKGFLIARYPEEQDETEFKWYFYTLAVDNGSGSPEGNHLGCLYYLLLLHITNSFLEPPELKHYIASMMTGRKSTMNCLSK
jgi:hypothetical protein